MLMRRTPLARTGRLRVKKPLGRAKRLRPMNQKRSAERRAAAFGEQAQRCRESACLVCGSRPCDVHHEPTRARGGIDKDTVPLCREHHDERHRIGRPAFEKKYGLDLRAEAERMQLAA